jgi:hypothetical protein
MDIGTGIALAGVWIFSGLVFSSKSTTGTASIASVGIAIVMTVVLK